VARGFLSAWWVAVPSIVFERPAELVVRETTCWLRFWPPLLQVPSDHIGLVDLVYDET
jgi:hypothetical protein